MDNKRFKDVWRPTTQEVNRLQGSHAFREEYTLAREGSQRLWHRLNEMDYVHALGAVTGNQAMQMVRAGVPAIYCSGWQVAADANDSGHMYPDQSLYSVNSVPQLVRKINNCLKRADQIEWMENDGIATENNWLTPIIADAEAGFGGPLNAFELMKSMIEAGAAGVHFEDQLSSAKKCGHLGGKVLVPASEFIKKLKAARLAADVMGVETILIARTDANSARLLTTALDNSDAQFIRTSDGSEPSQSFVEEFLRMGMNSDAARKHACSGHITSEGFYRITGGIDMAINRGLQYAPYADMLWCETSNPSLEEAKIFADAIHEKFPGKMLAYNCSPSFNWSKNLDAKTIGEFQSRLGKMGYKFQFITLAGFHQLNYSMFKLALQYQQTDMSAYSILQDNEFLAEKEGYTAHKHQREVGVSYFDLVAQTVDSKTSTLAEEGSTEEEQF